MPIVCCIGSYVIWAIVSWYNGNSETMYMKFLSTLIIMLFIVHPLITQYFIQMFDCKEYDGDVRLQQDLQIICWDDLHGIMTYGLALPCFIFWGLGIPAVIYWLMAKEERNLETEDIKIQFGFLYLGYKRDVYFWEIVIMYRKIIALMIAVLLSDLGVIV